MTLAHDAALTHQIIGLAMRVHTHLGPGLLEIIHELCLCHEFDRNGLPYARQVEIPLEYDGVRLECNRDFEMVFCSPNG